MRLENLFEKSRRINPPDIDVEWQRTRDGRFAGEAEAWSGRVYSISWDPKDPQMVDVQDMRTGDHFREELSFFVAHMLNDERPDAGYQY